MLFRVVFVALCLCASSASNRRSISAFVGLTPFIEQQALWEQIANPNSFDLSDPNTVLNPPWPPMGPSVTEDTNSFGAVAPSSGRNTAYQPWMTEIPTLRCPSDPGTGLPSMGRTNYAFCTGDSMRLTALGPFNVELTAILPGNADQIRAADRGMFSCRVARRFRDVLDGLANTIAMGEIATDLGDRDVRTLGRTETNIRLNPSLCGVPADPERPLFWAASVGAAQLYAANEGRGYRWASGDGPFTVMNTVLPPNSPFCSRDVARPIVRSGPSSASSRHQGGAHVLLGDGAVRFITDSIEAGDSAQPNVELNGANPQGSQSPYGLWGALGTRGAKEVIDEQF